MIAEHKIVHVDSPTIQVELGESYAALRNQDVEVLIFPRMNSGKAARMDVPLWGAMRGSIRFIASDFDEADSSDWDACQ